jgi:dipeptidyl aminopeptidase/acylaminoacyl peptidase
VEKETTIRDRSPVTHARHIKAPLLIINGADDAIVPPNQAYSLAKLVENSGATVEVKVYDGEGHM